MRKRLSIGWPSEPLPGEEVEWNAQSILKNVTTAVDIAMFGRMYTDESSKPPKRAKKGKAAKESCRSRGSDEEVEDNGAKSKRRHANH